ncbi:unnamed protein product [Cylicostephanus goldi]|uniref:Uncharacterized protein n=1 Tax=Cylicostephanus goldi TaxID=71465 RepID=A0A3P6R4U7_CYLGO|nr:unnamed protein product [Cylicostephanus goldi]
MPTKPVAIENETHQELLRKMMMLLRENAAKANDSSSAKSPTTMITKNPIKAQGLAEYSISTLSGTAAESIQSPGKDSVSTPPPSSTNDYSQPNTSTVSVS